MSERATEKFEKRLTTITNIWKRLLGAPSTARDAEAYRETLFPEFKTVDAMLEYLQDKTVLDIGSGLTHENPYSLINIAARNKKSNIFFMGLEPKVGGISEKFSLAERLWLHWSKLRTESAEKHRDTPGKNLAIAGAVPGLQLPDKSINIIISNAAVGTWITDEAALLQMFKEFNDVLTGDGEIRIKVFFPKLFENDGPLRQFIDSNFEPTESGPHPPGSLLIFKKKRP
ncbi:hypothetical protein HY968_03110 [Candidatus Kaiserbacteria bacterium]|nr:hypothetical protein [Candidatus Kaiserbacteria bacterium]